MPPQIDPAKITPLGQRILDLIAAKGHPHLKAAAASAGVDYVQLLRIVKGDRSPTVDTLERILAALGSSMEELYGGAKKRK